MRGLRKGPFLAAVALPVLFAVFGAALVGGIGSRLVRGAGQASVPGAASGVLPGRGPLLRAGGRRSLPYPGPHRRPPGQGHLVRAERGRSAPQRAVELRVLRPAQHARGVLGHSGVPGSLDGAYCGASNVREVLGRAAGSVLPVGVVRPGLDLRLWKLNGAAGS